MLRSRLKNIINKSKEFSNKSVGDSFEQFKKSLPKEIQIDSNYRLEAAWKAYGSPKNYKEALWEGMIQPIDDNIFKLPSIGYNEDTKEYEYLNKGKENETVIKDIRVWDNDVIPFVKELKQGGYVRIFNEEKNCWTYSKNKSLENNKLGTEEINSFKQGGSSKKPYSEWIKDIDFELNDDYDLERAYNELPIEQLEAWKQSKGLSHLDGDYKKSNHPTYGGYGGWINKNGTWHYYISPILIETYPERNLNWYKDYWDRNEKSSILHWIDGSTYNKGVQEFKQGGQMNVIPSGALHARKNNMEGAGEDFTSKGIPVMTVDGKELVAEIERNEIIFNKETTEKIEKLYKLFDSEEVSLSEKDEIAVEVGKLLSKEIVENTLDNTGLILEVELKM